MVKCLNYYMPAKGIFKKVQNGENIASCCFFAKMEMFLNGDFLHFFYFFEIWDPLQCIEVKRC